MQNYESRYSSEGNENKDKNKKRASNNGKSLANLKNKEQNNELTMVFL